jgi:peroxiredoxin family protein
MSAQPLAILLLSGTHERAHYAFALAAGGAALGRPTLIFATNGGCHALAADWSGLADGARDALIQAQGVAGLGTLRDACQELGVTLLACAAGLQVEAIPATALLPGVAVSGIAQFLSDSAGAQTISL